MRINSDIKTATTRGETEPVNSPLSDSLEEADVHVSNGDYHLAVKAYEKAIDRFADYDMKLRAAVDSTIGYLATPGCPATKPHREARKMIALRNRL